MIPIVRIGACFCLLFYSTMLNAQKLEKNGLTFLSPAIYQTIYPQKGTSGDYPMIKVSSWACNVDASAGLNYKGKNYRFTDFNGQLQVWFNAITVTRLNISFDVAGVTSASGKTTIEGLWQMGESKGNALVGIAKGGTLSIVNTTIHGISEIKGLEALKTRIDELEAQDKKEAARTNIEPKQGTFQGSRDYWGTSSNTNSGTSTTSSTSKPSQSTSSSSATKANDGNSTKATAYQGVGKYESSGSGIIYPVGPGTKRADGNYDVVDKYGKTHIIDAKANEKLEIKQRDTQAQQRMASQQQKIQEQFRQQEAARQKQAEANRQRQAQVNAFADQLSNSVYQIGTGIAGMINDAKAKKERERQRQLEIKQREEALKLKLEQERQFRVGVRTNIFNGYKDSAFPISTSKIPYEKLYYFIYAYDATNIDKEGLDVYISEKPFEITKYSDGTWPYKKSVADKIVGLTPHNEIIIGYYPTEQEALQALDFFKGTLAKSNVFFKYINYQQGKKTSVQSTMNNFWKKEADTSARDSTSTKPKDKYWK